MKAATSASAPMCTGRTVAIRKTTSKIKIRTSCTDTLVPRVVEWMELGLPFRDVEGGFHWSVIEMVVPGQCQASQSDRPLGEQSGCRRYVSALRTTVHRADT